MRVSHPKNYVAPKIPLAAAAAAAALAVSAAEAPVAGAGKTAAGAGKADTVEVNVLGEVAAPGPKGCSGGAKPPVGTNAVGTATATNAASAFPGRTLREPTIGGDLVPEPQEPKRASRKEGKAAKPAGETRVPLGGVPLREPEDTGK